MIVSLGFISSLPVLVLSNDILNHHSSLAFVCPITNTNKKHPFHIELDDQTQITGVILCDQAKMLEEKSLVIEPLEIAQVQPAGVDIRLGNTFSIVEDSSSGIINLENEIQYKTITSDTYILLPNQFVLATTMEYFELPDDLTAFVEECEVFPAPFAVFLDEDDSTCVEPDISVICDASKLDDKGCQGAPDWVIEIVSPSSKVRDYMTKFSFRTSDTGLHEWLIKGEARTVIRANYLSHNL